MARAAIQDVRVVPETNDAVRFRWTTIYHGEDVRAATGRYFDFDDVPSVVRTPSTTGAQAKAAIKAAIQARATELGYGNVGVPQHVDELFHGL